ncbi:MAG: hypothetical protein V3U93_11345 [Alphaproteobacteria bacterium]
MGDLTYYQAHRFLDLVGVNPLFDPAEITGLLASQLIVEAIGFIFPP